MRSSSSFCGAAEWTTSTWLVNRPIVTGIETSSQRSRDRRDSGTGREQLETLVSDLQALDGDRALRRIQGWSAPFERQAAPEHPDLDRSVQLGAERDHAVATLALAADVVEVPQPQVFADADAAPEHYV